MSGLVRRIEKRLMKRAGYTRERWIIVKNAKGEPEPLEVRRGGEITDPDDTPIGRRWPALIPTRAKAPTKAVERKSRKPRGSRRGHPSKKWLAFRAERREMSA